MLLADGLHLLDCPYSLLGANLSLKNIKLDVLSNSRLLELESRYIRISVLHLHQ